jgi:hypothetical protein
LERYQPTLFNWSRGPGPRPTGENPLHTWCHVRRRYRPQIVVAPTVADRRRPPFHRPCAPMCPLPRPYPLLQPLDEAKEPFSSSLSSLHYPFPSLYSAAAVHQQAIATIDGAAARMPFLLKQSRLHPRATGLKSCSAICRVHLAIDRAPMTKSSAASSSESSATVACYHPRVKPPTDVSEATDRCAPTVIHIVHHPRRMDLTGASSLWLFSDPTATVASSASTL